MDEQRELVQRLIEEKQYVTTKFERVFGGKWEIGDLSEHGVAVKVTYTNCRPKDLSCVIPLKGRPFTEARHMHWYHRIMQYYKLRWQQELILAAFPVSAIPNMPSIALLPVLLDSESQAPVEGVICATYDEKGVYYGTAWQEEVIICPGCEQPRFRDMLPTTACCGVTIGPINIISRLTMSQALLVELGCEPSRLDLDTAGLYLNKNGELVFEFVYPNKLPGPILAALLEHFRNIQNGNLTKPSWKSLEGDPSAVVVEHYNTPKPFTKSPLKGVLEDAFRPLIDSDPEGDPYDVVKEFNRISQVLLTKREGPEYRDLPPLPNLRELLKMVEDTKR